MTDPPLGARLGSGRRATVYEVEGGALKLYDGNEPATSAFGEAAKLATVAALGAPVPQVHAVARYHGCWGVLTSRCEGPSLAERLRAPGADVTALLSGMATLHRRLHGCSGDGLPSLRSRLRHRIASAGQLTAPERRSLIDGLSRFGPERRCLCHGDFHPGNILGRADAPAIIDWADATEGDAEADVCRSYLLLRNVSQNLAETYLDAYAASPVRRTAVLEWLPIVAAARLAEGVGSETAELLRTARFGKGTENC